MRNRPSLIAALLAVVLTFALVDPFRVASGRFDTNPYTEMAAELEKSSTTGVLVLASYNDFYKFPVYNYLRDILGTRLAYHGEIAVEYGYDEVLTQASLGEESFLRFLKSRNMSHLIIPMATAETGTVFHRWSTRGTINLDLNSKAFSLVHRSVGNFPLALYTVNFATQSENEQPPPLYSLNWSGVRPNFYELLRVISEWYVVKSARSYEERTDTAWVFEGEEPRIILRSPDNPDKEFILEMKFVAAYGEKAPPQVLRITQGSIVKVLNLKAGEVSTVSITLTNGESIKIENVFGCPQGVSFDPEGQDIREFCYGLRDIQVRIKP
jgi:hypothetical protein